MTLQRLPRKPELFLVPRDGPELLLEDGSTVATFDDAEDPGLFYERVTQASGAEIWFLGIRDTEDAAA